MSDEASRLPVDKRPPPRCLVAVGDRASPAAFSVLLLNLIGVARWNPDFAFLFGLGAIAGLGTALGEEALFRSVLLRPPEVGRSIFGPAALSALIFALWHPFQTYFYDPLWEPYA